MRVISFLVLSAVTLLVSCQSTVDFEGTVCILDVSMTNEINRLDEEGDVELSILVDEINAMQNIEFLQSNFQHVYDAFKQNISNERVSIKEPYDLINEQEYIDSQEMLEGLALSTQQLYRPIQFQQIQEKPLKAWRRYGLSNNCDQILRIKSDWVQIPNYQFLKKTTYHLGVKYRIELLDVKSAKIVRKESVVGGAKPLNSKWLRFTIQDFALNMEMQSVLKDVFDAWSNELKQLSDKL